MNEKEFKQELIRLGIEAKEEQLKQLIQYYKVLVKTKKKMNLTRIIEKEDIYLKHFYDSLTITKIYNLNEANTLLDIGCGAGFPGIVLKIFFPHLKITLIDALQKRVNYLNEVIDTLKLEDIKAYHIRAEDLAKENKKFDIVTARAVASLPKLLEWAMPLVSQNGSFIAMKGNVEDEITLSKNILDEKGDELIKRVSFLLPNEQSKRNLLLISHKK